MESIENTAFEMLLDTNLFIYLPGLYGHEEGLRKMANSI